MFAPERLLLLRLFFERGRVFEDLMF